MKFSRATIAAFLSILFSGCITTRLSDDQWFHPGFEALDGAAISGAALPAGFGIEEVTFPAADGTPLYAIHLTGRPDAPTILYFGGDSFRIARFGIPLAQRFAEVGVNAFIVDYRGYGKSEGKPSIEALKSDAVVAFDTLRQRMSGDQPIVIHGFSLGSFMGFHVALERPAAALVLESTATNVQDWARNFVPLMARGFVRIKMSDTLKAQDNLKRVKAYTNPILLITGSRDSVTPPRMSRSLLNASSSRVKKLHVFEGSGHGSVMAHSDFPRIYRDFLAALGA